MENRQEVFNEYMNQFIRLSFEKKCKEVIEEQKRTIALLATFASNNNIPLSLLKSKEVMDLEKEEPTNEDYIEAMMVYSKEIEEFYGEILLKILND